MQKAHTLSEKEARHPMSRGELVESPTGELCYADGRAAARLACTKVSIALCEDSGMPNHVPALKIKCNIRGG